MNTEYIVAAVIALIALITLFLVVSCVMEVMTLRRLRRFRREDARSREVAVVTSEPGTPADRDLEGSRMLCRQAKCPPGGRADGKRKIFRKERPG